MRNENIEDYKLSRNEMREVKNCITTYMGYTFGGAGLFAGALVFLKSGDFDTNIALAFCNAICGISIIVSLVLWVLFYKFNSHNFHAGYCKLLNKESWLLRPGAPPESSHKKSDDFLAWEWCIGELRKINTKPGELHRILKYDLCDGIYRGGAGGITILKDEIIKEIEHHSTRFRLRKRDLDLQIEDVTEDGFASDDIRDEKKKAREGHVNKWKRWKGLGILFRGVFGRTSPSSWGFPVTVTVSYLVLHLVMFVTCLAILGMNYPGGLNPAWDQPLKFVAAVPAFYASSAALLVFTFVVQVAFWLTFSGKLFALMRGDATVEAYQWRFVPVRAYVLKRNGIILTRV